MLEVQGDIWDYHKQKLPIVITTNGTINARGEVVMGRGVALQAKQRFPKLPKQYATRIRNFSEPHNTVFYFSNYRLFTFPVKHNWNERADLKLITRSALELVDFVEILHKSTKDLNERITDFSKIYMVRPGCENGKRDWETEVKPIIKNILDNKFTIVQI